MLNDHQLENNKDEEVEYNQPQGNKLNKGQKISVILLAFFAVLVVFLWSLQFKKSISEPFAYKDSEEKEAESSAFNADNEELLKTKDTDGDGLSDWDELYFYKTSPYLEDSDSDGFSDKEEIDSDNDPNCPIGRDCYSAGIVDGDNRVVSEGGDENNLLLNDLLEQLNMVQDITEKEEQTDKGQEELLEDFLGGQIDAAILREMLVGAGMDENMLNQISDEDLMKSYQEMIREE